MNKIGRKLNIRTAVMKMTVMIISKMTQGPPNSVSAVIVSIIILVKKSKTIKSCYYQFNTITADDQ